MDRLREAHALIEANQPDQALAICSEILNEDHDDALALFMAGHVMMTAKRFGLAHALFKRCLDLKPERAEIWINLGMCLEYADLEGAEDCFKQAIMLDPDNHLSYMNLGIVKIRQGNPEASVKLCEQALELCPESDGAHENLSLAHLMLRNWKEGWKHFEHALGGEGRKKLDYGVPEWDGKSPGNVVIYGEQGIGDEILYASCIPDAMEYADVVIDTQSRLKGLFERSFDTPTYGTRFEDDVELLNEQELDYQCAVGSLPGFYRRRHADFPGTPYLTPDPERCIQWKALLDTLPGRKIGLAWSGGLPNTLSERRSFDFSTYEPLLDSGDTFISLEYKDPGDIPIIHWPRAVEKGVDFDETAALVSQLDLVITVCTAVVHLAGGLGVKTWCLVPNPPGYRYHLNGNLPWYKSVTLHRQETTWDELIGRLRKKLDE